MHFYSNTQNSLPRAFWNYNYTAVLGTTPGALCLLGNFLQLNDTPTSWFCLERGSCAVD